MTMTCYKPYSFIFNFIHEPMFISYSPTPTTFPVAFEWLWLTQAFKRFTNNINYKVIDLIIDSEIGFLPGSIFNKEIRRKCNVPHFVDREATNFSNSSTVNVKIGR